MQIPVSVAEQVEAEANWEYVATAAEPIRAELGIASARIGGGTVVSMSAAPPNMFIRALGFGVDEPITRDLVAEICDFYRAHGAPKATLQLAPSVLPPDWADIRAATGLVPGGAWFKLARELKPDDGPDEAPAPADGMRVDPVTPADAEEWATAYGEAFSRPPGAFAQLPAAGVGRPGWQSFALRHEDEVVGGGSVFVRGTAAHLFGAAVLPAHRNKGGQSAVLAARIAVARAAGCRWVVAETYVPDPGKHNPSLANMRRAGLEVLYQRRNWIWEPAAA
ncbi:GNAT family N-acetyltransferase [Pseudonocardia zijingensis]|uniref:N-acetyltransferase domain-containing protein n=1 Tax=Pseudonocardia zijingensis TaxID=153376 RepID=A0ABN1PH12_9PSEU